MACKLLLWYRHRCESLFFFCAFCNFLFYFSCTLLQMQILLCRAISRCIWTGLSEMKLRAECVCVCGGVLLVLIGASGVMVTKPSACTLSSCQTIYSLVIFGWFVVIHGILSLSIRVSGAAFINFVSVLRRSTVRVCNFLHKIKNYDRNRIEPWIINGPRATVPFRCNFMMKINKKKNHKRSYSMERERQENEERLREKNELGMQSEENEIRIFVVVMANKSL